MTIVEARILRFRRECQIGFFVIKTTSELRVYLKKIRSRVQGTYMIKQKITAILAGLLLAGFAQADNLTLKEGHPDTYVVKKGDTLWDISGVFLDKPWYWPKIWNVNPQVKDPHWIYPGDVLNLVYVDGQPRLVRGVTKLSPSIRRDSGDDAIKTINLDEIRPFLSADYLFPNGSHIDDLPFVLGNNDMNVKMMDVSTVYVKGALTPNEQYGLYAAPKAYKDPNDPKGGILGYRAALTGVVIANRVVDGITECTLIKSVREISQGDRVMSLDQLSYDATFAVKPAPNSINAVVLENVVDATYAGRHQVVVLSAGTSQGLSNGDVVSIYKAGVKVAGVDPNNVAYAQTGTAAQKLVAEVSDYGTLPDVVAGHAMVFKAYSNLSLALITDASEFIANGARVSAPKEE